MAWVSSGEGDRSRSRWRAGLGRARGRLWPSEGQELLLRAALMPPPASLDAWRRIGPGLALGALDPGSARLLPLVWSNVRRHGDHTPLMERLEERYRSTRATNEARLAELGGVLRALDDAGTPTVVLKGAALAVTAYTDLGLRPMSDLDVLVPIDRVDLASRTLQKLGWVPASPVTPVMTRMTHSVGFQRPGHVTVDLHWHVFEECCRADDDDDAWAAAIPAAVGGAPTRVLAAEDQLINVCAQGEKWVRVPGIRWVADALIIIRGGHVRWDRLAAQAAKRRFVLRLRHQLDYLRSEFDAPIPPAAVSMLAAAPVSRVERLEQRWGVRDRRRPWALVYWFNHVRSAPGIVAAALTFPWYLQATWQLASVAQVPGAAVARVLRHVSARSESPPSR